MKTELSPFENWMVKSNLKTIQDGTPAEQITAQLELNGYFRIAKAVEQALTHHIAIYNGKEVIIDYVADPKREFAVAAMRVQDNLKAGQSGYVKTPKGETFIITYGKKQALRVKTQ